jgi:hypothetical protein
VEPARNRRRGVRPTPIGRSLLRTPPGGEGPARSPAAARDEDIASLPESGRGIDIMRACVDDVTMTSGPENRTVVALEKRLAWRPGAPFADDMPADELADVS